MNIKNKIFGIGLGKTGTTSLCKAFCILGIKSIRYSFPQKYKKNLKEHQFLCDMPIPVFFKALDRQFSHSKFIYTIRDMTDWLNSCEAHWRRNALNPNYKSPWEKETCELLGTPDLCPTKFRKYKNQFKEAYIKHDTEIKNYFRGRPNDLLIIDICNGEGWDKLIPFIGLKETPIEPFPQENIKRKRSIFRSFGKNT